MKPKISSGTRDFGSEEIAKRSYIRHIITEVFERNAYKPLETPAFEQLSTLLGKYGEEGDKLMFKILNNGLHEKKETKKNNIRAEFEQLLESGTSSTDITERALKYDLTIPFARYVVLNSTTLSFPFKRYQMQPVWRADRPQKGRYREFWQCDADVIGVQALSYDAELIIIYDDVFERLGIADNNICVNNRKILAGLASLVGMSEDLNSFTLTLDKLDKIGWENVKNQLVEKKAEEDKIESLHTIITHAGNNREKLQLLQEFGDHPLLQKGIEEVSQVLDYCQSLKPNSYCSIEFDVSLARGLDYYTGMIVEVKNTHTSGSLGGGGRYDELTAIFGLNNVPGVGISFGLDRIYNLMDELALFPPNVEKAPDLFVYAYQPSPECLSCIEAWRREGLIVEVLYEKTKIDKVYKKAEALQVTYVCIWEPETSSKSIKYKNIISGQHYTVDRDSLVTNLKN